MPNGKEILDQIGSTLINQLIQLVTGYILSIQGKPEESAAVLARVGLPTNINISTEDFLKFLETQKKVG